MDQETLKPKRSNILITPADKAIIETAVVSGQATNQTDAIRQGLRLLKAQMREQEG